MTDKSKVYFLKSDQFAKIPAALEQIGLDKIISQNDFVAIKIHFGEKGNKGYVKPEELKPLIKRLKETRATVFITDANTIYKGERTDAVHHLMVASEHNFHPKFLGIPVIIADGLRGNSYVEVDITSILRQAQDEKLEPKHFKKIKVAEAVYNADVLVVVSHFKGHELCGIGGAVKNLGMGCASRAGKYEQHNSVVPRVDASRCTACGVCIKWCGGGALSLISQIQLNPQKCTGCGQCILACNFRVFSLPWNDSSAVVQEKIAEYACGVLKNKRAVYISFLTFLTPQCDCFKTQTKPLIPDIGIVVSTDPVAIDQACMDLVDKYAGRDIFKEHWGMDGNVQIQYAEKLGLGKRNYELIDISTKI
jgi:uncharacterized Fe-S center protein